MNTLTLSPEAKSHYQSIVAYHLRGLENVQEILRMSGVSPDDIDELFLIRVIELGAAEMEKAEVMTALDK